MTKKLLAILFSALMIVTCMAGCSTTEEVWVSVEGEDSDTSKVERTKRTTTGEGETAETEKTEKTKKTKKPTGLDFTPIDDAGAKYDTKGEVSIAVDTVRPTDYDAMFDIMEKLYPNIKFTYDMWAHTTNDDAREYLSSRAKTGTQANIIWDEAGELPSYLTQGWIYPITKFVKNDPEYKYVPDNLKKDYTFGGEVYAVPHQATFNTVTFNMDLLNQTGMKLPNLEWSIDQYQEYLKAGDKLFSQGKGVGIEDLFDAYERVCFYETSKKSGNYGARGYNWDTKQMEVDPLITGAKKFREWRTMLPGVEAWNVAQSKDSQGKSSLQAIGLSSSTQAWKAGKALLEDDINVYVDKYSKQVKFKYTMWTTPNYKGKMMMHVDHCFISANTPDDRIEACYQALRFMTFSTNGNLARLSQYDKAINKGAYTLNSVVFFPATNNQAVLDKFSKLDCTTEVHEYFLKNVKNCGRYDTFKLVPELKALNSEHLKETLNAITDGLKEGEALREPAAKFNTAMKEAWETFDKDLAKVQKKFNDTHK